MKIFLIILLFVAFVLFAIFVYYKYLVRYRLHRDCEYICKNLKNNISFNKDNISNILLSFADNISSLSRNLLLKKQASQIFVNKNDLNLINQFLSSLGKGDVSYEINNINYYENIFSELKNSSYSQLKTNATMYLKLIIGIGLAVVIILI